MTRFALTHVPALLGNGAIDRLFEEFFQNPEPYVKQTTNGYPLTDIYKEEDGSQVIEMALAGFSKEDILINTEANKITISADGSKLKGQLAENRRRIAKRAFKKSFVDYHNTLDFGSSNATFENGLLRIQIPLREEVKPRQITIK
jgi:HSP20 family molecular chaperone IbpA